MVKFYRAVSEAEFQDIIEVGHLRVGRNSAEGKHLTGNIEEARAFGRMLYPEGGYRIIEVSVASVRAKRFFKLGNLDRCGRAWFAEIDDLRDAVVREMQSWQ